MELNEFIEILEDHGLIERDGLAYKLIGKEIMPKDLHMILEDILEVISDNEIDY